VDRKYPTLDKLAVGCSAAVRRVRDEDPAALRYLAELNMTPGTELTLNERGPFNGPLYITVGDKQHIVSPELARSVQVEMLKQATRQ
jgi:DtxR family Mn-dependent transcriptional regulator